jgi:hypothetical protein
MLSISCVGNSAQNKAESLCKFHDEKARETEEIHLDADRFPSLFVSEEKNAQRF